jgi:uncharacterized membrane protein YbhN (UPF0104 family)
LWLLASTAAAAWIVWTSRDDIALLADAALWVIVAMTVMHAVSIVTQAERFRVVLQQHAKRDIGIGAWTRMYVRGRLFSTLIPQSAHVYRGLALRQDHGVSPMRYLSSLATQTWMAVLAGLALAAAILSMTLVGTQSPERLNVIAGLVIAAVVVGASPILLTRLSWYLPERVRRARVARLAAEALTLAGSTSRDGRVVVIFLAYVLIGLLAGGIGMTIAFAIGGEEIAWTTGVAVLAFVNLGNVISITPGNLGVQEIGIAALAVLFGYSPALGVIASVVVRLSNIVALAVLVLLFEIEGLTTRKSTVH